MLAAGNLRHTSEHDQIRSPKKITRSCQSDNFSDLVGVSRASVVVYDKLGKLRELITSGVPRDSETTIRCDEVDLRDITF